MTVLWTEKRVPRPQSREEARHDLESSNLLTTEQCMRRFISALQVKGVVIPHVTVSFGRMLDPSLKRKYRREDIKLVKSIRVRCIPPAVTRGRLQINGARAAYDAFMKTLRCELKSRKRNAELLLALKKGGIRRVVIEEEGLGKSDRQINTEEFLVEV